MAVIPGTNLSAPIVPQTTDDNFPTHFAELGKGGKMEVADTTARNAIPAERRTIGMFVTTQNDGKTYTLAGGIANTNWGEFVGTPGADGKSPYIGANGNWYTWNGTAFVDTGLNASQFILANIDPDDPAFPTEVGKFTATTKGQAPVGGPPGADGGVGAPGLDGDDAPVPTPRVQSVTVVGPGQDPKVTITKFVDPLNAQNVYFDFGFILPQPIVEGGGSGSGLPENVVVTTTEASLRNWCQVPGSYIIIPGEIVLTDDFGIVSGVTLDGIGSGYINGSDGMMFGAYDADNVTLKNIKIVTYDCNFAGRNVLVDNCRIKTQNGIWFYGGGYHQDASYMVRNNVFDDIVFVNIENGSGGIIATGCVLSYTFNVDSSHDGILLVNNIEGANLAPWGFGQ